MDGYWKCELLLELKYLYILPQRITPQPVATILAACERGKPVDANSKRICTYPQSCTSKTILLRVAIYQELDAGGIQSSLKVVLSTLLFRTHVNIIDNTTLTNTIKQHSPPENAGDKMC